VVDEDLPQDDMSDITERSEVKALMERGREKGFLTYDEVNDALPSDTSSDQIDDVMSMFGEHDIEVVDGAEKIVVAFHDGTEATATVVGTDIRRSWIVFWTAVQNVSSVSTFS